MIDKLWRDVREAYRGAFQKWVAGDTDTTILLLQIAIQRTQTLILALEKGAFHGKNSDH